MYCIYYFFFFKQKTAYEMLISYWSSGVCSSDLFPIPRFVSIRRRTIRVALDHPQPRPELEIKLVALGILLHQPRRRLFPRDAVHGDVLVVDAAAVADPGQVAGAGKGDAFVAHAGGDRKSAVWGKRATGGG